MIHEEKKVAKIVEELTMFFFTVGADEIESRIKREADSDVIWVRANYDSECREELDYLNEFLNEEKNAGMEDIYWELAGVGDPGEPSQLLLVGMMLDRADVEITEDKVKLHLYKELMEI